MNKFYLNNKAYKNKEDLGFALILAILYVALILIMIVSLSTFTTNQIKQSRQTKSSLQAYQIAQSGIEDGINQIIKNPATFTPRRYYVKTGNYEDLSTHPTADQNQSLDGYYETNKDTSNNIIASGFSLWNGEFLKVMLLATKSGAGYKISQITTPPTTTPTGPLTWTPSPIGTKVGTQIVYSIIWDSAHSKYVAAGIDNASGNVDAYVWETTDLATWTPHAVDTSTGGQEIRSFIYDTTNNKYIAAGSNSVSGVNKAYVWESSDLITWTPHALGIGNGAQYIYQIFYDTTNNKYIAGGVDIGTSYVWESTNLTTWTTHIVATSSMIYSIIYANGKYVAAASDDSSGTSTDIAVWESTNLTSWTKHVVASGAGTQTPTTIIYDSTNNKYVIGGYNSASGTYDAYIWESPDLISWTAHAVATGTGNQGITTLIYDATNHKYVAGGYDDSSGAYDVYEYSSTNLTTWTSTPVATGATQQMVFSLIFANNEYFMGGYDRSLGTYDAMIWYKAAP